MQITCPNSTIRGDVLFRLINKGPLKKSLICRFSFNTAFLTEERLSFSIKELDPCSIKKDSKYSNDFRVNLVTKPRCDDCNNQTPLTSLCPHCLLDLEHEIPKWDRMHRMIYNHKEKNCDLMESQASQKVQFPFGVSDYEEVLRERKFFRNVSFFQHAYNHSSESETDSEEMIEALQD